MVTFVAGTIVMWLAMMNLQGDRQKDASLKLRVLLIDDDLRVLDAVQTILEMEGHEVVATFGGRAGIDAFGFAALSQNPFGVVITDLTMPDASGWEVAEAVKKRSPLTPVILITGMGEGTTGAGSSSVDYTIGKPLRMRDLRAVLNLCGTPRNEKEAPAA